ncbi:MAG: hypothetical protein QM817_12520 [Archangium sp.]
MKLDQGLAAVLKMDPKQAQAFAGALLLFFEDLLKRHDRADLTSAIREAIPELNEWQNLAPTLPIGAVTTDAIAANAGTEGGQFNLLMMQFAVEAPSHAAVKKLVTGFLAERIGSAGIEQVRATTDVLND